MGPLLNFTDGMKKLGISSRTLSQGRGKDLFNPFRKWEKDEGKSIQKIIDALYEEFAAIVSTSRKVSKKKIEQMGADLFMATEAQTLGLIDASSSSYSQALLGLITAAGLKESDSYQVMSVSRPRQFLEEMIAGFSLKSSPLGVKDLLKMDPATKSQFLFLYR